MKTVIRLLVLILISVLISSFCAELQPDEFFNGTIFNVSGIMFSLGLGLIVTFNLSSVKNKKYIIDIRKNLNKVRNSFIFYFGITVICYVLDKYFRDKCVLHIFIFNIKNSQIGLNCSVLFSAFMFYSIIYYIINFLNIQKLNDDIFDNTNE